MMNKTPLTWRKGIYLSATFLICILTFISCKKKENPTGKDAIDQTQILQSAGIDTFSLKMKVLFLLYPLHTLFFSFFSCQKMYIY